MESLYLLIPLSVILVFVALWLFFRASDDGQFDDLVGPGLRILQDDDRPPTVVIPAQAGRSAAAVHAEADQTFHGFPPTRE